MTISRQDIDAVLGLLAERFPKTFFLYERKRVPLKLRIDCDIVERLGDQVDRKQLSVALQYYVGNLHYRRSQKPAAPRYDLDGNPCGEVSEADASSAARDVAARKAAAAMRKQLSFRKPQVVGPAPTETAARCTIAPVEETTRPTVKPAVETAATPPPVPPKRLGLADLREAAARRKAAVSVASS